MPDRAEQRSSLQAVKYIVLVADADNLLQDREEFGVDAGKVSVVCHRLQH